MQKCADDTIKIEHDYHYALEQRGIQIAKLDSLIEAKKELVTSDANCYERLLKIKDDEIRHLTDIIEKITHKI